jgi:FkbM family methyltransferase
MVTILSRAAYPDWMKSVATRFPRQLLQELRRVRCRRQLRAGTFVSGEPEYAHLDDWIAEGDWVVDVGAHVGGYTVRLSQLVGEAGRVLAFEPVPDTFELLAANIAFVGARNVSLFNVAVSANSALMSFAIPQSRSGIPDFCYAGLTSTARWPHLKAHFKVLTLALDALVIPRRVTLVKLDVEGHELIALRGMEQLLRRDRPRLIVECPTPEIGSFLGNLDYESLQLPQSPNRVFFMTGRGAQLQSGPEDRGAGLKGAA